MELVLLMFRYTQHLSSLYGLRRIIGRIRVVNELLLRDELSAASVKTDVGELVT